MPPSLPRVVVLCDRYPELSETFVVNEVAALRRLGAEVTVEAVARPVSSARVPPADVVWAEESTGSRLAAMIRLAVRHPLRCGADVFARRRWRREEAVVPLRMLAPFALRSGGHVHVHFAAHAALCALRVARITRVPWSVTAHAYEIFQRPANLTEKLREAAFATTGCGYNADYLERVTGTRPHEVVMGVDVEWWRRGGPPPGGRRVVAIGRLVEKKGFGDLVEAAALLALRGEGVRVSIAGDGPWRAALELQIARSGADVELLGAVDADQVRELLEGADLLCAPCVVAADGDRDSMPVVVKEALAMEVPVVGTDAVGLPEVIDPRWGRLVSPHDPQGLAAALAELLALAPEERASMGRAGRAHVAVCCTLDGQAERTAALISACARDGRRGGSSSPRSSAS